MIDYKSLLDYFRGSYIAGKIENLASYFEKTRHHGDFEKWNKLFGELPEATPSFCDFIGDIISVGVSNDIIREEYKLFKSKLMKFSPWRKGPFSLFDIFIDTEWRSDFKWNRLDKHISNLKDRAVLDVGSGNGYHCWKMRGEGANFVLGLEPYILSVVQFQIIKKYIPAEPVWVAPVKLEEFPVNLHYFDTVFSMGVLYHQKSPFEHFARLRGALRPGGELILETLVINGKLNEVLVPEDRYAKMRNVWFIPSTLTLESWLRRAGFIRIRLINVTKTMHDEQRKTEWMKYESLSDFLDPKDKNKTIEGYPAPTRAIIIAEKPV